MVFQKVPSIEELETTLSLSSQTQTTPIGKRMRAAYYLRYHYETLQSQIQTMKPPDQEILQEIQNNIITILCTNLEEKRHGSLLRHEIGFVLGQLRDMRACNTLMNVLDTEDDCVIARHECAEALAAIGCKASMKVLEKYCVGVVVKDENGNGNHPIEIVETCQIALKYLQWKMNDNDNNNGNDNDNPENEFIAACPCMEQTTIIPNSPYLSIDPAPPHIDPKYTKLTDEELGHSLSNPNTTLFHRYRILFTLRNRNTPSSIHQLNKVLITDTSSALLRHEVAYVLGQIQSSSSKQALIECLRDENEHRMVRHEAAEALGAVMENCWDERGDCESVLKEFQLDMEDVVRESCIVALDAVDYWNTAS